ncbi:CPXCG motif-containing cysteine-rich protein [Kangiella shandongensis]|uniref:CPXCG motif-containing cysteine-rich protein n=1 Tax=Kangiella shandongensis TaxID=2763258 RepID=UPI001CBCFBBC|nr:CPXCG motif-containing cysteine-rich protein [Kangiella shandongensis]
MNQLIEKKVACPYCGESITVLIDGSVPFQEYIEDCQVCCRPIEFTVIVNGEDINLTVNADF